MNPRAIGSYMRKPSTFRNFVEVGSTLYPPEANRYHLYVSYACPWASRCLAVMHMKGLEDAISVSVVHPTWQRTKPEDEADTHLGWVFKKPDDPPVPNSTGHNSIPCDGCVDDNINHAKNVREIYEKFTSEKITYSVPILWDKQSGTIVNNESSEIVVMLNAAFNEFAKNKDLDLKPLALADQINSTNEWIYPAINNGVYRCGFATCQEAYSKAFVELYDALDRAEQILSENRYVCGDVLTICDIYLFMTLLRFDEVYVVYFKCNKKLIREYPNLQNFCREMYQIPAIQKTIHMDHIKNHYYTSHPLLNTYAVIPIGPNAIADFSLAHNRASIGRKNLAK